MSVPNQSILFIEKPNTTMPPFLQVSYDDWQTAYRLLSPSAFCIYLYLAQNANGYKFEYSPTAIENTGMMKKGTAIKARQELERMGYIEDGKFFVESSEKRALRAKINQEINKIEGR